MPLILDPKQIDKLRVKKRLRRVRESKTPLKAERELRKRMNDLWVRVLFPATDRIKMLVAQGASPEQIAELIDQSLRRAEFEYDVAAQDIVQKWKLSLDEETRRKFTQGLKRSLGVDVAALYDEQPVADVLAMGALEAANLIKTIPGEHLAKVARAVADNFSGRPLPEGRSLVQQIQHLGGVTEWRAKLIARDQTAKLNGALNQARQQSIGVEEYIWRTVKDQRVVGNPAGLYPKGNKAHGNHYLMDGVRCRWDDPTVYSTDGGRTWKKRYDGMPRNHPKDDIQCFPGFLEVDLSNGCDKFWQSWYSGQLVSIATDDGIELKATPNHPVLTGRGWVPMNALKKGDYLVKAFDQGCPIFYGNKGHFVPSFHNVYETLKLALGSTVTAGSETNFYGDGTKGDVNTVHVDSFLWGNFPTAPSKLLPNLKFARSKRGSTTSPFSSFGRNGSFLGGFISGFFGSISAGLMSCRCLLFSFLSSHFRHSDKIAFGLSSESDVSFSQNPSNNGSRNSEFFGQFVNAVSGNVGRNDIVFRQICDFIRTKWNHFVDNEPPTSEGLAQIVCATAKTSGGIFNIGSFRYQFCRIVEEPVSELFSGHVYTLQSFSGYYAVGKNKILAKNCRCHSEPILDIDKILAGVRVA